MLPALSALYFLEFVEQLACREIGPQRRSRVNEVRLLNAAEGCGPVQG
jgi:hypothetical protein